MATLPRIDHTDNYKEQQEEESSKEQNVFEYFVDLFMPGPWLEAVLQEREEAAKAFADTCQLEIHGLSSSDKGKFLKNSRDDLPIEKKQDKHVFQKLDS